MADDNNINEIGPKDELIDAIAELDDEGDRVIELKDEDISSEVMASVRFHRFISECVMLRMFHNIPP